ncbi:MAG: hypothetical protein M1835_002769, partial [Candelina submexicana]
VSVPTPIYSSLCQLTYPFPSRPLIPTPTNRPPPPQVQDTRPAYARQNLTDASAVPKYTLPTSTYETLPNTVLAFKKSHQLGRFDPHAPELEKQKLDALEKEAEERGIGVSKRCRVGGEDIRRGVIRYTGLVPSIPNAKGIWVGVELDEPLGKNDGSVNGTRYFDCGVNKGVFVRPERVEVGDWPVLGDLEELEEI